MRASSDYDKAKEIYEQAMEVVYSRIGNVIGDMDELSLLVEELASEKSRERADELIDRILVGLDNIG